MHLCCIALAWSHPTGLWPSCPGKSAPIICIWWFIDLLVLESYPLEDMSVSFVPSPVSEPQRQRAGSKRTEGCPVRSNDGGWIVRWWLNRPRMPNVKTSHPHCSPCHPKSLMLCLCHHFSEHQIHRQICECKTSKCSILLFTAFADYIAPSPTTI